jgi:hypothetical protein
MDARVRETYMAGYGDVFTKNNIYYIIRNIHKLRKVTVMALSSIYQLISKHNIDGQDLENVFFYNHASGSGDAVNLAGDWVVNILPLILALQVHAIQYSEIDVINMGTPADFEYLPDTSTGAYGAVSNLPSFNAIGFTMKLDTRAVAKGSKRISGVPAEVCTREEVTSSGYLTNMEALRLALGTNIAGSADTWQPVVLKRVKTAVPGTTPVQYTYRLPRTDLELVYGGVREVLTSPIITSQTSRKA